MAGGVKEIRLVLDEDTYNRIVRLKGNRTWKDFLISLAENADNTYLINKVNETIAVLKQQTNDERSEIFELIRVFLIHIIKKKYEDAIEYLYRIENKLTRMLGKDDTNV